MTPYKSKSGNTSGVTAYEIGQDFIFVWFEFGIYKYSYKSAEVDTIEKMKELALNSEGLSTFISQHKPGFEKQ